jgi:serine phosphatase RsbU (regulator of sigma subunit)
MLGLIKKTWIINRSRIIIATTAVLFVIGLINFFFIFYVTAQSNDECLWLEKKTSQDSVKIIFQSVKVKGVTWNSGIRDNYELIAIDGVRTRSTIVASQVLDKVPTGDYATYTVSDGKNVFETHVLVKKLINFGGLALGLLSFLWLIVGFVVVMAKPEGKTQRLFYKIGIAAILYSINNLLYRGTGAVNPVFGSRLLLLVIDILWTLGGLFFGFLLIKFFCLFPRENTLIKKKWFNSLLNISPIVLFVIVTVFKMFTVYRKDSINHYNFIGNGIGLIVSICFILGLVLLFFNYAKLETKRERNSIFVILVAYLIGVLALIYTSTFASAIAGLIFNNPEYFTPIILIALIPIAFGYSIFRYSLMDVSMVVRNTIVYGAATIALAALYFLLIYSIGLGVSSAFGTEYKGIIAGVVFVLFAFVFQSTKDKFQGFLTEKFYPEQYTFQKRLLKFSGEIAGVVGKENIFNSIQELFVQTLRIETFGIMIRDAEGKYNLIRYQGIINPRLNLTDDKSLLENYCLECNTFGKKGIIERQDFKELLGSSAEKFLSENIYTIVPLFMKSKLTGLLLFGLKYSGSQFAGKDIDLLLSAANQAAVSIENARLYESETEKQKMERDLENARHIQETLLPKVLPTIDKLDLAGKMIPAMHVGGDYFDMIKVSDYKLFVVVGDVSGKGLSASFYMSKLQTMIRLYCTEGRTPSDILVEVNKRIYDDIEKNWFITVVLALFDLEDGTVKICRAGHTPIIRIRNKKSELFQPTGIGIGLDKGEIFQSSLEEITLKLEPNDLFCFYSDGVTETMNPVNELYGIERLNELLVKNAEGKCSEIQNELIKDLKYFQLSANQYDDITILFTKNLV